MSTATRCVSVTGVGNLGSALAGALLRGGCDVAVWNRTPERTDPLVKAGAREASTLEEALHHAEVVVFALPDYAAVDDLFSPAIAQGWLQDRTLLNIGTGSGAEALRAQEQFTAGGAEYLDGACGSYPSAIGSATSATIYSGPRKIFDRIRDSVILPLGSDADWVGEDIGAANSLFMSTSGFFLTSAISYFEGAAHADRHRIPVAAYTDFSIKYLDTLRDLFETSVRLMEAHDHADIGQAALQSYLDAADTIAADAEAVGARTELLAATIRYLRAAVESGEGASEVSVLFENFRGAETD